MNKTRLQELCQKQRWDLPQYTHRLAETDRELRFAASVTVNGSVFESPDADSRLIKEAQNKAAGVALETLSASLAADPVPSPPLSPAIESLSPQQPPTESLATYKSQLLVYAQKRSKELPKYSSRSAGPPHALQFKATVVIDGRTFECPKFFKTVREAEHAAAEVALANLPKEESSEQNLQDDVVVPYKTLLQEYTQKRKEPLPVYTTVKVPDSSLPLFLSTVEVCGRTFKGVAVRTKKQAEASAAKVALDNMEERKQSQISSSGSTSLPMTETHNSCSSMESKPTVIPIFPSSPISNLTKDQVLPESKPLPVNPIIESIQITKVCDLDPAPQSNPGLTTNSIYTEGPMLAVTKDDNEWVEPSLTGNKIHVYPYYPGFTIPDGAISLPFSDNTWVAASLDFRGMDYC